jgi:hypothetical protein
VGQADTTARDHEYKRLGTCSILAALDLHDGHVIERVERRHRSREFIALLKDPDAYYPAAETLFGKTARTFLRHIRVQSWEELRHRILKGIEEINADPVVHRWKKFEALGAE